MTNKMVVVFDVATGNIDSVEGFDSNGRKHKVVPMPSKPLQGKVTRKQTASIINHEPSPGCITFEVDGVFYTYCTLP